MRPCAGSRPPRSWRRSPLVRSVTFDNRGTASSTRHMNSRTQHKRDEPSRSAGARSGRSSAWL
eukprot:6844973-Pyramimonas_sp.AAC.1